MITQVQDDRDSFFLSSRLEVNAQAIGLHDAGSAVEEDVGLPVFLFATNKALFDLALANGFRQLGGD